MAARVGSVGKRGNAGAEAAADIIDKVGIVGLAKTVGVGIVAFGSAEAHEGQVGAMGAEIAARDGIDIDEMARVRAVAGRRLSAHAPE